MKKRIMLLIFIVALALLGFILSYQKIENEIIEKADIAEKTIITEDLNQRIIKQKIKISSNSIEGIKVKTATFDRIPVGTINMQILNKSNVIVEKEIKGAIIPNNNQLNIKLEKKVELTPGEYTIIFDLKKLHNTTPITFYINKAENLNSLSRNGECIKNSSLDLQYYTHEFSPKRLMYIYLSVVCLLGYTVFVVNLLRKSK